ncbi:MAG: uncharacterized protein KVP18_003836 [Porospora cf. gigantea A]|nr:MAG: hypothetical protein KVP18_003836 [Porospora cf. gigantea A]
MKGPSNPSLYGPELQAFIATKFDPLLSIVGELNDKLSELEREVRRLKAPREQLPIPLEVTEAEPVKVESVTSKPWIFSVVPGTPISSLQALLHYNPDNTIELNVNEFRREEDLWSAMLEELPAQFPRERYSGVIGELRSAARKALLTICRSEMLVVLRNVPGKPAAAVHPAKITIVAILCASIDEAWKVGINFFHRQRVEQRGDVGRIAVVLEGTGIGKRLRAGANAFPVEPLNGPTA